MFIIFISTKKKELPSTRPKQDSVTCRHPVFLTALARNSSTAKRKKLRGYGGRVGVQALAQTHSSVLSPPTRCYAVENQSRLQATDLIGESSAQQGQSIPGSLCALIALQCAARSAQYEVCAVLNKAFQAKAFQAARVQCSVQYAVISVPCLVCGAQQHHKAFQWCQGFTMPAKSPSISDNSTVSTDHAASEAESESKGKTMELSLGSTAHLTRQGSMQDSAMHSFDISVLLINPDEGLR
eukprot:scaffold8153_cov19-Tisochrysis_lutea.AAC.1